MPGRTQNMEKEFPVALTDNCDIYAAINEAGINRVVRHAMRQRPSLFNYGTVIDAR